MNRNRERDPQDIRQEMQIAAIKYIDNHQNIGEWKASAFANIGGLWNSVTHDNPKQAINLAIWDIERAFEKDVPADVTKFVLEKVYEYSNLLQSNRARNGSTEGILITKEVMKGNLKKLIGRGKISREYFDAIFS